MSVWEQIEQDTSESSTTTTTDYLSFPPLGLIVIAIILCVIAVMGKSGSTMGASGFTMFDSGSPRAYSLLVAATIISFIASSASTPNMMVDFLVAGLAQNGLRTASMCLSALSFLFVFMAAIMLAVLVTPYDFTAKKKKVLAYSSIGLLSGSFISLMTSFILEQQHKNTPATQPPKYEPNRPTVPVDKHPFTNQPSVEVEKKVTFLKYLEGKKGVTPSIIKQITGLFASMKSMDDEHIRRTLPSFIASTKVSEFEKELIYDYVKSLGYSESQLKTVKAILKAAGQTASI